MSKMGVTASQTVGPFLSIAMRSEGQEYLVPKNSKNAIKIHGIVYDGEGTPVPDAVIEIWQANINGKYDHPEDNSDNELIKGFSGFGRSCTNNEGQFFFVTQKPGRVNGRGNSLQAPHLAVNILARGMLKQQVTRIYFSDEVQSNAEDPVLNQIDDELERKTLIANFNPNGGLIDEYEFHIYLQGENETIFFDV
ncbi:MAG: protocatechuate 3,4-dioxygenase subunit alpha [Rhodospirillaceae bacterium]|nr:protocatechuate 3,4-dioxygenase subunit alpha [Rhodospirillaceae bacterium]OUT76972.1 MAG: protocatechuate 3,4-dioxygenase subunit alpha [Rhodospirillaceae bacterium TMED23]|tara:strand:- start:3245 stop:3826 length:582 start_codon:yes stop_codon:yes gene_type:complete